MKKRIFILIVLVTVVILAIAFICDGVDLDNFNRLTVKMSKHDTHWHLGGPIWGPDEVTRTPKGYVRETWLGWKGAIHLYYDDQDEVFWMEWNENSRRQIPVLDRIFGVQAVRE